MNLKMLYNRSPLTNLHIDYKVELPELNADVLIQITCPDTDNTDHVNGTCSTVGKTVM